MPYFPLHELGAEETTGTPVPADVLATIDQRTVRILEHVKRAEVRWKWQTIAGVVGAVFAAVRLGIIAVPKAREYRNKIRIGSLGEVRSNPARRRRARRRR